MNENYHNGVEKFVSPMQMHDKTKENVKISSKSNTIIPTLTDHILLTLCSVYVVFSFFICTFCYPQIIRDDMLSDSFYFTFVAHIINIEKKNETDTQVF